MTVMAAYSMEKSRELARHVLVTASLVVLVAASQWGMLWLAAKYVREGRLESTTSPEAIFGLLGIVIALLALRVFGPPRLGPRDGTFTLLQLFLLVAILGELLRPDLRLGNVSTFLSIGLYYYAGSVIGRDLAAHQCRIPALPALLFIYTTWYLALAAFYWRGDLGFYGELPYSGLYRLQFTQGFKATELPIYVGFQLPVVIYAMLRANSASVRLWACLLALAAIVLVVATVSSAALFAMALVLLSFLFGRKGVSAGALFRSVSVIGAVFVVAMATSGDLTNSVRGKLEEFALGEGVRALIYAELVADIVNQPLGIGKGRFVETNNFSWLGEGVYPHQNLLGIGAELGVPALLLFVAFLAVAFEKLGRSAFGRTGNDDEQLRLLATTVFSMLLYQQFRGLFQDTWVVRETYLWLGVAAGALLNSSRTSRA